MPEFFIHRPVFAWVVALFIILIGVLSLPKLPIDRYPSVAPPAVSIYASYPGATPQAMNDSVISLIERELSSVKNILYFESSADTSGMATITATFEPGTDPDMAQVDVQNRLKTVEARLPQTVRQTGVTVESASSNFLMLINLESKGGTYDSVALNDYMARNIIEELKRVNGVGRVQLFGAERAMRVWVQPQKLVSYNLTLSDVTNAISEQNVEIAPGALGAQPIKEGQRVTVPLTVQGQLTSVDEFSRIVLRANADGSSVTLGDVARVELGPQTYGFTIRVDGREATTAAVQLSPGANAVKTAKAIELRMEELSKAMPSDVQYSIPFNTAPYVSVSIEKVVYTLFEAMFLVFLVMYLFLQNIRYTIIPTIVAPIALLGTFAVMLALGYSINVLTMFGMVLAIGIIVDDAIVVVENVERIMAKEGLKPKEATIKAMKEITGAVIGITLVLSAVFIPMAFASGSVGVIYRQFSVSMATSILFSAFLALTLTPALCATLLKPVHGHEQKKGFFGWFDRNFDRMTNGYSGCVAAMLKRTRRSMIVYALILAVLGFTFMRLPSAFLPEEDQGHFMTAIQLPADATVERTQEVVEKMEEHTASRSGIMTTESIMGFGFAGSGPNAAFIFTMLKDWDQRNGATVADEIVAANEAMAEIKEGYAMSLMPPSISELGNSTGFALRLQDRANQGAAALAAAQDQLIGMAYESSVLTDVYSEGLPPGASINLEIDRAKAEALGVPFSSINETLTAAMGSRYINDFPNNGRLQMVIVQADADARMQLSDVLKLYVRNNKGGMVALSELVKPVWTQTPLQYVRYNSYPSMRITGSAAPGLSSGDALLEMERLASKLPAGFAIEWTGQSLQEKSAGAEAPLLLALSMLVVFMLLAALYESWTIPVSVMLVVPLGLIGAVAAVLIRDLPNDVFFKIGMITIIGLSAKNAILIVEFAKAGIESGKSLIEATIEASSLRLRPIIMTSLAFTLGVVPLMLATGASSETQNAIGTGVFGGMISATILAIFWVPVFFVVVMSWAKRVKGKQENIVKEGEA